jgi:hypothetical protein
MRRTGSGSLYPPARWAESPQRPIVVCTASNSSANSALAMPTSRHPGWRANSRMERADGIEPTRPAWKAGVLPLNYAREAQVWSFVGKTARSSSHLFNRWLRVFPTSGFVSSFSPDFYPVPRCEHASCAVV